MRHSLSATLLAAALLVALALAPGAAAVSKPAGLDRAGFAPRPATLALGSRALAGLAAAPRALVAIDRSPRAERTVRAAGARLVSRRLGLWSLPGAAAAALVPRLQELGALRYAEEDRPRRPLALPYTDPYATPEFSWHLYAIGVDQVPRIAPGMPITVIDDGLDVSHQEFGGRANTELLNEQTASTLDPAGPNAHGTFVAATAAAPANGLGTVGVYPDAALRVCDAGDETLFTGEIIACIGRALDAGRSVINLSFGAPLTGSEGDYALYEAIVAATGEGSLVVAAAGNEFESGNPQSAPAAFPHVLTAAAADRTGGPADFSSSSLAVDLAAPGVGIPFVHPTDAGQYLLLDGTSFSAAIVSAAAAWAATARPELDVTQLFELVRLNARDIGEPGFDLRSGFGLLSLPSVLSAAPPPPDPQEPNDDIDQVRENGIFVQPTPVLPRNAAFGARLDVTEDPEDVYRVVIPPGKTLVARVSGADLGLALWRSSATTVYDNRCRACLALSSVNGRSFEQLRWRNMSRRKVAAYLDVWVSSASETGNPAYSLSLRTVSH